MVEGSHVEEEHSIHFGPILRLLWVEVLGLLSGILVHQVHHDGPAGKRDRCGLDLRQVWEGQVCMGVGGTGV